MPEHDLRHLISRWLSRRNTATPAQAAEFLAGAEESGHSPSEVVSLLSNLLAAGYYPPQRVSGDGSGSVQQVEFTEHEIVLRSGDGCEYTFTNENGFRWRTQQGWVGRTRVEEELGTWPGYLDALEDLWDPIRRSYWALKDKERKQAEDFHAKWEETYDGLHKSASLARHPALHLWRSKNPAPPESVPATLRAVRHIKRLEVMEPSFVYFLLCTGEVVYVGQTTSPWPARILQHLDEGAKVFDDVWYLEVDRSSVGQVEAYYIRHFCPKYNRSGLPREAASTSVGPSLLNEMSAE